MLSSAVLNRFDGWRILYPASLTRWRHVVEPAMRIWNVNFAAVKMRMPKSYNLEYYLVAINVAILLNLLLLFELRIPESAGRYLVWVYHPINICVSPGPFFCLITLVFVIYLYIYIIGTRTKYIPIQLVTTTCCQIIRKSTKLTPVMIAFNWSHHL